MRHQRGLIVALALLLIVAVIYTWATWRYFTLPVPGGNDFLAHYSVWDLFIEEGVNPYSDQAAKHTQILIRGRPAEPGEDQNRLTYPFYSILVHGPLTFIDYALARAIYMTLLQGAIIVGTILTLRLFSWGLPTWMAGCLLAWSILHYPQSRGIILGQFAPIGFLSLVGSLYLLREKRDLWAGIVLVVSTMKPTLIFLVVPFMILWALTQRRMKFIFAFLCSASLLVLGSLIFLPSWINDWFERILAYPEYTVGQSPVWLLTHEYLPTLGNAGETLISLALLLSLMVIWWRFFRKGTGGSFFWVLGMTLLISNVIVPRSATTNYVMLLIPILGLFAVVDRNLPFGRSVVLALMGTSLIGHWWLHYVTVVGNQEQPVLFLPIPIALGIGLIMGRSMMVNDTEVKVLSR